jgi:hypothetical protein
MPTFGSTKLADFWNKILIFSLEYDIMNNGGHHEEIPGVARPSGRRSACYWVAIHRGQIGREGPS